MSRGKSLKVKKNDVDSGESNLSSINSWDATEVQNNVVNQTVRIHNGQEGIDVVIDNATKSSRSNPQSFELSKKSSIKFDSQLSSMTYNSQYGSLVSTGENKLEVMTYICIILSTYIQCLLFGINT